MRKMILALMLLMLPAVTFAGITMVEKADTWNYQVLSIDLHPIWNNVNYDTFDWENANWQQKQGAFGNSSLAYNTYWQANTDLALQKVFTLNEKIKDITMNVAVDNGFIAFVNGTEVARQNAGGYTNYWEYQLSIDASLFKIGQNKVEVFAEDYGGATHFDMEMKAEIVPEPTSIALISLGLATLWRKKRI